MVIFKIFLVNVDKFAVDVEMLVLKLDVNLNVITHLVDVRILARVGQNVELGVDVIEKVNNFDGSLCRGVFAAEGVESHDAAEQDGDIVVAFSWNRTLVSQFIRH